MNHAIDLAVGCHYFLPGLRLPQYLSPDGANCKRQHTFDSSLLLIYRPRKDERLSWPSWLTCSGRFTHISGHAPISCRSSAGQGKFAGQRPTFCHCATPPTIRGVGRSNIFGTTSKLVDGFRRGGVRNLASRDLRCVRQIDLPLHRTPSVDKHASIIGCVGEGVGRMA